MACSNVPRRQEGVDIQIKTVRVWALVRCNSALTTAQEPELHKSMLLLLARAWSYKVHGSTSTSRRYEESLRTGLTYDSHGTSVFPARYEPTGQFSHALKHRQDTSTCFFSNGLFVAHTFSCLASFSHGACYVRDAQCFF